MNASHPAVGSPVGSAIAHYKFDEGYGTIAHNSGSCATCSGTLTGMDSPPPTAPAGPTKENSAKPSLSTAQMIM